MTVKSKSYTLYGDGGEWLGQIVLTNDGFFLREEIEQGITF